jgi:hypothetical protein
MLIGTGLLIVNSCASCRRSARPSIDAYHSPDQPATVSTRQAEWRTIGDDDRLPADLPEMRTGSAQTPLLAEGRNLILTEEAYILQQKRLISAA